MSKPPAIFISGGGSGIGQALAVSFARQGWVVGIGDVSAKGVEETIALIGGSQCFGIPLDVSSKTDWDAALFAFQVFIDSPVNVVINNAGIGIGGDLVTLTDRDIERMVAINLIGSLHGARAAYPYLREARNPSCLLNIASASALYGTPGSAVYSATKFALRGLTEALDIEWQHAGIRVCSLMPDYIDTPLLLEPASQSGSITKRERIVQAGVAFTSLDAVTAAAFQAIHGTALHTTVGKSARQMALAARFAPRFLREQLRGLFNVRQSETKPY